jgi:hypothetical protein
MHWTALLIRPRIPPEAVVIEDLSCAGCGYNLRGLRAGGSCPECAAAVRQSLAALQAPDAVAAGVRGLARATMGLAAAGLVAGFGLGARGVGWLGVGLLLTASACRGMAALELRARGRIGHLAFVARRLRWLCAMALFDLAVTSLGALALYVAPGAPRVAAALPAAAAAWVASTLLGLLAAASLGSVLGHVLGYDQVERELRAGRRVLTIGLAPCALAGLALAALWSGGQVGALRPLAAAAILLLVLAAVVGAGFVTVGLLHLAGAAERERHERHDVLDASN